MNDMAAENVQNEKTPSPVTQNPAMTSSRKKKNEEATFLEDIKDHIDEFIHASMDEHKTCFKKTIQKVLSIFSPKISSLLLPYKVLNLLFQIDC